MFSGFSHADPYVVLIAAGGSPALEVAPTAAFELNALKRSAITCSLRASDSRKLLANRRSTCVRRGVNMVPGLISGTTREVFAPPDNARPSDPFAAASACVMLHCARICWPGRFCSTPPIWICCQGSVYEPVTFACDSQPLSKSQYEKVL